MRINFALSTLKFGGGMKILIELAQQLAQRGHEVSITTTADPEQLGWTEIQGVEIIAAPFHRGALHRMLRKAHKWWEGADFEENEYVYWDEVSAFLRALPVCDVCIATSPVSAIAVALDSRHTAGFNYLQHFEPLIFSDPFLHRLSMLSASAPLHVIANSSWLKGKLVNELRISERNVTVLPSAVNTDVFHSRMGDRFPKNGRQKRVVMMGKPHPWKGFADALAAMRMVFQENPDTEWIVYAEKDVFPKDSTAPYTILTGVVGDALAELLSSADVVIVPSWYESSPLPVLEALACKAALVTTSFGTEDLVENGKTAIVVAPRDPVALAAAISSLLTDDNLHKRLVENGATAVLPFTWEKATTRILDLFSSVLAKES